MFGKIASPTAYEEESCDKLLFSVSLQLMSCFKNKTRYTPYVSTESQISRIATNKGNIERQCSIYNVLSIKDITLDSKQ